MKSRFLLGAAAPALAALAFLSTAEPASAQYWYGSRGFGWGAAGLAAGIVGGALAVATAPLWASSYYGYSGYYPAYAYGPGVAYAPNYGYDYAPSYSYAPAYSYGTGYGWLPLRGIFARFWLWWSLRQRRPQRPGSCPTCTLFEVSLNRPGFPEALRHRSAGPGLAEPGPSFSSASGIPIHDGRISPARSSTQSMRRVRTQGRSHMLRHACGYPSLTEATTPGPSRLGWVMARSPAPRSTRRWRRVGSRTSGEIEWLGTDVTFGRLMSDGGASPQPPNHPPSQSPSFDAGAFSSCSLQSPRRRQGARHLIITRPAGGS
jgi:hypothetical protein